MITSVELSAFLRDRADGASAAELHELRSKLSVADAERRVAEIEAARREALVRGSDATVDAVESNLNAAKREVERTAATIEELDARIAAAERAELNAELYSLAAEATNQRTKMGEDFATLGKSLDEAARAVARIQDGFRLIGQTNKRLLAHRRAAVQDPYSLYQNKFGQSPPPAALFEGGPRVLVFGRADGYEFRGAFDKLAEACRDA